ncbi:MAG TPA: alanine--glyoxylate aminotransferase family protein [Gemmatimonadales bacterium]|nr:alanine--glyoxylate aminotransferase family protein [Gemmatimonadales bacterium]
MTANPVGHLDPYFVALMDQTMGALRRVFRTTGHHTIPVSGTGSAGLEAIMLNLLEPGDSAIVAVNGYFGARIAELGRRAGAEVRTIETGPGEIADPAEVERLFREKPAKLLAFVHVETSTGACQPAADLVQVARRYDALVAMDCVTSLGGMPVEIDGWGVDAAGSCSQKCLGAPPGLGPITLNDRAMATVRARQHKPSTWYLDLSLLFQYWGEESAEKKRVFHHTAPVAAIYGFHEALSLVLEEGLETRWARHQTAHQALARGLDRLGLARFTPSANRCPTINVIEVPKGLEEARIRSRLLGLGVEMGGGLGPLAGKVWRVGVMGYNAQEATVERFLGALEEALREEGWRA